MRNWMKPDENWTKYSFHIALLVYGGMEFVQDHFGCDSSSIANILDGSSNRHSHTEQRLGHTNTVSICSYIHV